jgi:hypothetical protein
MSLYTNNTVQEENASQLSFGKEFSDEEKGAFLMQDEVLVLLQSEEFNANLSLDTTKQTLDYIQKITGETDVTTLRTCTTEIRARLADMELILRANKDTEKLHSYELITLSNLITSDCSTEEAMAWVPSLCRFDEESLNVALQKIIECKAKLIA